MKRRDFLKNLGAGYLAMSSLMLDNPFRPRFRIAKAAGGKKLVVVFQKGGNDGLNTIVPYGDPGYYPLRPTIGIPAPNGADPTAALDIDGFFGFHPSLASFQSIYGAGDLAILPTVHYAGASRSHFDAQFNMETARGASVRYDGWLNRYLTSQPGGGSIRAAGFPAYDDASLPDSLRGPEIVSTFRDLTGFGFGLPATEEAALRTRLGEIYAQEPNPSRAFAASLHDFGATMVNDLAILNTIDFAGYVPSNGAVYPNTNFGRGMQQTAQLIKEDVGLEVAALTRHQNDTHDNQGGGAPTGRQAIVLRDFANGIAAFYQDLGSLMSDVMVVTMTEFGRTARENASRGTDHGNASAWFVMGNNVNGGMYLGSGWPGVAAGQLNEGRDLTYTLEYKDVMGEAMVRHMGNPNIATILPDHTYNPIGFLSA